MSIVVVSREIAYGFVGVTLFGIDILSGLVAILFLFFGREGVLKGGKGGGFLLRY